MLILIITILALSLGVWLYLINKGRTQEETPNTPTVPGGGVSNPDNGLESELEQPQVDAPEENTDQNKFSSDINFLESNFEIEELYKEETKIESVKEETEQKEIEITETEEKTKKAKKESVKKKPSKKNKDQKTKGAKRGRKPKPKDDMLLHS